MRVFLVATDDHLAEAFRVLACGTRRRRRRKPIIFESFARNPAYESTDLIALKTSRADMVLVGISYPANLHGVPREAIKAAQEEHKPHGVYLEHPDLFCENGFAAYAPHLSWIFIPEERHRLHLAKIPKGASIHVTGRITEPHGTAQPSRFHRSGLSTLVRTLTHLHTV